MVEVGGGLRTLQDGEREVLDGYPAQQRAQAGRGQVLAPWPNRLGGGAYRFDGVGYQLPVNDLPAGNAIHGLVRWQRWNLEPGDTQDVVRASTVLAPQPGWPTWLELAIEYRLRAGGLAVSVTARNAGPQPCPFGFGMHPYLAVASGRVDDAVVTIPYDRRLLVDDGGLPVRWAEVDAGTDFRDGRLVGTTVLDTCYATGSGGVTVDVDDSRVWADGAFRYVQVFTGDTDPAAQRRRSALAVEPMTCPPDAFRTGEGLIRLAPGEQWSGRWGIDWAPRPE